MADKPLSLQDHFLNSIRRAKSPVTIFLVKGVKLQGVITWFDAFSLLLRRDGASQLVYKHSISTIMPSAMPGANDPWTLQASTVGWLTVAILWGCAAWFLFDMRRNKTVARLAEVG